MDSEAADIHGKFFFLNSEQTTDALKEIYAVKVEEKLCKMDVVLANAFVYSRTGSANFSVLRLGDNFLKKSK